MQLVLNLKLLMQDLILPELVLTAKSTLDTAMELNTDV